MTEGKKQYKFKIIVVGDAAVGKTSLIKNYTQGSFREEYLPTIGAQFSMYEEEIDGDECQLFIWDIAGQNTFHFLRPAFYQGSRAAIVVYSLEETYHGKKSFEHIDEWHDDINLHCGNLPTILLGNKMDLVDEHNLKEKKVLKLVKKRDLIGYYRTSAKTGVGVIQAFQEIIKELHDRAKL